MRKRTRILLTACAALVVVTAIQGHDTRNLLGQGRFEGDLTVDGQPLHPDGGHFRVQFPPPDIYWNMSDIHPSGYIRTSSPLFSILPDRNWDSLVALLAEVSADGTSASFHSENCCFWVSGPPDRETAMALAAELTRGTTLSPLFQP